MRRATIIMVVFWIIAACSSPQSPESEAVAADEASNSTNEPDASNAADSSSDVLDDAAQEQDATHSEESNTPEDVSDPAPPCGQTGVNVWEPWSVERTECSWELRSPPQCGGALSAGPMGISSCICNECTSNDECDSENGGRCIVSAPSRNECTLVQRVCVYPDHPCYDCVARSRCLKTGGSAQCAPIDTSERGIP